MKTLPLFALLACLSVVGCSSSNKATEPLDATAPSADTGTRPRADASCSSTGKCTADAREDAERADASEPGVDAGGPGVDAGGDGVDAGGADASHATTGPSLRQFAVEQTDGGSGVWEVNSVRQFKMPTEKGNTLWVAATIPNDGAQTNVKVVDTQGNTFTSLSFEQDNSKGTQSVWQFYATDIAGDGSTPDKVTVQWGSDNYKGVVIAEIANVSKASLVGKNANIQDYNAPSGDNTVTSGVITVALADTPALLLALSMDTYGGSSDTGGDGYAGPLVGDGYTNEAYVWDWDPGATCTGGVPCSLGAFETKVVAEAGSVAGLFTARAPETVADPGSYVSVAAVFH